MKFWDAVLPIWWGSCQSPMSRFSLGSVLTWWPLDSGWWPGTSWRNNMAWYLTDNSPFAALMGEFWILKRLTWMTVKHYSSYFVFAGGGGSHSFIHPVKFWKMLDSKMWTCSNMFRTHRCVFLQWPVALPKNKHVCGSIYSWGGYVRG